MRDRNGRRPSRMQHNRPVDEMYDPENVPLFIQVSVNILEARQLVWENPQAATSYVVAALERKKNRTSVAKNQEEPVYREYLVFDMYMSIKDVQRSNLWLGVMEPKCYSPPHLLGEANIDLGSVWALPNHQVYHKWVQLSLPRKSYKPYISFGYLKVDISITIRGEVQVMPATVNYDKIEDNLHHLPLSSEQQKANYVVTVHAAFNLPIPVHTANYRRYGKGPTTHVRVSYCGLVGKTSVQQFNTDPRYNDRISIVEMFPNMNHLIKLEVCIAESCFNRVISSVELNLKHISHDGDNGFLPTFGPSLLHMYGATNTVTAGGGYEDGAYHKGALFVSLKTIVPYDKQPLRSVNVQKITPIEPDSMWSKEDFCVYCSVFEMSMLDQRLISDVAGLAMTIADISSERECDDEFINLTTEIKNRQLHYTGSLEIVKSESPHGSVEFRDNYQILQQTTRLPDFRFRMYRNNIIQGIVANLERIADDVEKRLHYYEYSHPSELIDDLNKAYDDASGNILKFLDIVNYSSNSMSSEDSMQQHYTELDQKQLALQKEEIEKIYHKIMKKGGVDSSSNIFLAVGKCGTKESLAGSRKAVKFILAEIKELAFTLKKIICKTPTGWPHLVIWLLNGGSRVAYKKINLSEIIYSVIPEQCGLHCGKLQTFYMTPIKCQKHAYHSSAACHCIAGKVEVLLWVGLFRQRYAFSNCLPTGYHLKIDNMQMSIKSSTMKLECRAFIYRAKITDENDSLYHSYNSFVRLNVLSSTKDSQMKMKTSLPVWNQILKVNKLVYGSVERLQESPPYALVEVYNGDAYTNYHELIGRFHIQPTLEDRPGYAPKLKWYEIYKGSQKTGQILMSIQLLYIPEKMLRNILYSQVEDSYYTASGGAGDSVSEMPIEAETDIIEPLPTSLIPLSLTYKADIYWWGLREVTVTKKPLVVLEIDELVIKSDVILANKATYNSNFTNGKISQIFESPIIDEYFPALCVRLYDSSTFGRKFFLGTNVIKHPSKFLIEWLPKHERDMSLDSASIMSTDFREVDGQMLHEKKSVVTDSTDETSSTVSAKLAKNLSFVFKIKENRNKWSFLKKKEPREEEITLLPVYIKENNKIKVVKKMPEYRDKVDWWTRFFQSEKKNIFEEPSEHHITIYDYELEYQPEFRKFKDWCSTLKLYNGKKTGILEMDQQIQCGFLKAGLVIYRWPPSGNDVAVSHTGVNLEKGYFHDYPENTRSRYMIRVYIVKALDLNKSVSGKICPYVIMNCGKRQLGDRKNHITNASEAIFGKMYEFGCSLPEDYLLKISLYDYDPAPPDDLIGSTTIDLEDRIYSKHRARVGLAHEYTLTGPCKWRDSLKPSGILEQLCSLNHLSAPKFPDRSSVVVNGIQYTDSTTGQDMKSAHFGAEICRENICLRILHNWHTLPVCGHHLVPEHVETRSLVHPDSPGVERGKIMLWVDIFPLDGCPYIPPPRDITPRKVEEYELRVIVWDVLSLLLVSERKRSWKTADLYVKVWIGNVDHAQLTDVHYNSLSGEGNFNWRMIFNFLYHHTERKIINKEKCPFTEYEEYVPPVLYVQVLDSHEDKKLGILSLNLNRMHHGSKLVQDCCASFKEPEKHINLFSVRSIRAWWPLKTDAPLGDGDYAGAIDLELTLLPKERAVLMPAGIGRNPPSPLPVPGRECSTIGLFPRLKNLTAMHIIVFLSIAAVLGALILIFFMFFETTESFFSFRDDWKFTLKPYHGQGILMNIISPNVSHF